VVLRRSGPAPGSALLGEHPKLGDNSKLSVFKVGTGATAPSGQRLKALALPSVRASVVLAWPWWWKSALDRVRRPEKRIQNPLESAERARRSRRADDEWGFERPRRGARLDLRTLNPRTPEHPFNQSPRKRKAPAVVRPQRLHFPGDNHDEPPSWKRPAGRWLTP